MEKNACKECGDRFERSSCLKRHAVVAHGRRAIKCPNDNCGQIFQKVGRKLRIFKNTVAGPHLPAQLQWSILMQGSSRLKRHLKHYHSVEDEARRAAFKFECPECHKKIRTKNLLDCHLKVCSWSYKIWLVLIKTATFISLLQCPIYLNLLSQGCPQFWGAHGELCLLRLHCTKETARWHSQETHPV